MFRARRTAASGLSSALRMVAAVPSVLLVGTSGHRLSSAGGMVVKPYGDGGPGIGGVVLDRRTENRQTGADVTVG